MGMVVRFPHGGELLLLLIMAADLASSDTTNDTLRSHHKSHQDCKNPEKCCKYDVNSPEFNQCCTNHGCCPKTCETSEIESSTSLSCNIAWSCCRYWPESVEFIECCSEFGCSPPCEQFSKGCCYNGVMYMFGNLVEEFSQECIQLVCAVQLSAVMPFFRAVIVPIASPPHKCKEPVPCHASLNCVDYTGLVRAEGATWYMDECHQCTCKNGNIACAEPPCPSPPHSHCVAIPGACCPEWNCSQGCIDEAGVFYNLGERWHTDDPCITLVCTEMGSVKEQVACTESSPPHAGCFEYVPLKECCSKWNCSGCVDSNEIYHPLYKVWKTGPCTTHSCAKDGIRTLTENCSLGPVPGTGCHEYTPAGECCPQWKCSGCTDSNGTYHSLLEEWKTDPCTTLNCTKTGIQTRKQKCSEVPAPHPSCQKFTPLGQCCPQWKCRGCFNTNGTFYDLGKDWPTDNPCTNLVCTDGGIMKKTVACTDTQSPYPGCFKYKPFGECCSKWNCSGCLDNGTYHSLNEIWQSDPCTTQNCTRTGIETTVKDCQLGPALHPSCQKYTPPGDCCPQWKCRGCFDANGSFHEMGSEWSSYNACTLSVCTEGGIINKTVSCVDIPPLRSGCLKFTPHGKCCPEWNCSGCVEDGGTYHPMNDVWKPDPCTTNTCTNSGIITTKEDCNPGPKPYPICQEIITKGGCCSTWNCSGCFEKSGTYHKLQEKWNTSKCITHECTLKGILTTEVKCTDQPHPNCVELPSVKLECCPKWNCGPDCRLVKCGGPPDTDCSSTMIPLACCSIWNCSGCYDELGTYHKLGSEWSNPCRTSLCTKAGIKITQDICSKIPPPHPSCLEYIPVGECCPKWNCSGCVDASGTLHPLGQEWKTDLCTTHACTASGIQTKKTVCSLGLAPYSNCNQQTGEGECCPKWKCRICVDKQGNDREEGESWKDSKDPCSTCTCKQGNTTCAKLRCSPPPPWPCSTLPLPGQCCPIYCDNPHSGPTVSPAGLDDCVDNYDKGHKTGEMWLDQSNSCIEHKCGELGFIQSQRNC